MSAGTDTPDRKFWIAASGVLAATTAGLATLAYKLTIRHGQNLLEIERLQASEQVQPSEELDARQALYVYGAPPGSVAMNFDLPALAGGNLTLTSLKGRRILLVFVAPDCPVSRELLPLLEQAGSDLDGNSALILIVSTGDVEENRQLMESLGVTLPVVVQTSTEVSRLHYVSATPMAYLLNRDGITETNRLDGPMAILGGVLHLSQADKPAPEMSLTPLGLDEQETPFLLARANDLPEFTVPLMGGGELTSGSLRGQRTLLVLFDPLSRACIDLLPDLTALHADTAAPAVVMISRRDPELTRALSLNHDIRYPVGIQRHWDVSRLFGLTAAPAACVVDPGGYLETDLVVGGQAVRDLMKQVRPESVQRRLVALASLVR